MSRYDEAIHSSEQPDDRRRLVRVPVSSLRRRQVVMLRPGLHAPVGAISVICGQQGVGKGTIIACLAAEQSRHGHGVLYLADEDSGEAVIRPRLQAAGANLDHVEIIRGRRLEDGGPLLPRDTEELAGIAQETQARLLAIDPWTNHVDVPSVDKGEVRRALMPLHGIAEAGQLCVLLSAHPVKHAGQGDPLSEIAHASAVSQVARAAFWVTLDPEHGLDERDNPYRLVSHIKHNLTPKGPTLRFELRPTLLEAADGEPEVTTVRAIDKGQSDLDYRQIRKLERGEQRDTKAAHAREWLREYLTTYGTTIKQTVISAGGEAGHTSRTLERAATDLCESVREAGGPAYWRLVSTSPTTPPVPYVGEVGEVLQPSQKQYTPAQAGTLANSPTRHTGNSGEEEGDAEVMLW
jgi:hypothetical protein